MKFEIPASQRDLKITKTALALSGIADAETYKVFTTPNAVVVIDGQMTAKELFSAAASLRLLASDLLMQLAESCDDVCENCDESCIERLLGGGIDASCYEYAAKFRPCGNEIMSNAYDMAEATYDELIARGFCLYDLFRHYIEGDIVYIVSVFKLVQELLEPSGVKGKTQFQMLMGRLPPEHKAKWFAGAALNSSEQAMASVMSTVLSRLNAFLDSELEQIICFDSSMDAESFAAKKSAIFLILPEEDQTKNFMAGLMIQNLSHELFSVADEHGGRLQNRVVFFCDELGTMPAFDILPLFSAGRSRRLTLVPIIQALAQLEKNYGKEGAEIIVDNVQDTIFGGFAPNSQTAEVLSKSLGSRTVLSGSVSRSKDNPSESLQMMERPLMTADELKAIPKGTFVVMKTGKHPMQVKLRLFLDWGITFDEPYQIEERANRKIAYADRDELIRSIMKKYPPKESLERPRSRVRREAPAREQTASDKMEALHVPNKEDYS